MGLFSLPTLFGKYIAMDLGTSHTLIHLHGEGVVLDEPSMLVWNIWDKKVVAVGAAALTLLGRTPQQMEIIRPLKGGGITDFTMARAMVGHFFKKVRQGRGLGRPAVLVSTPSDISSIGKKAIREAIAKVGGGRIHLIAEPVASAIGAGLDICTNHPHFVVNIGSGTTELAVLFHGKVIYSQVLRPAGDEVTEALSRYLLQEHNAQIGQVTAEKCKQTICSAWDSPELSPTMTLTVKDLDSGGPSQIEVEAQAVRQALQEPLHELARAITMALDSIPENFLVDIRQDGLHLCGGGALLHGLERFLQEQCQVPCCCCSSPLTLTVQGCALVLENMKQYRSFLL